MPSLHAVIARLRGPLSSHAIIWGAGLIAGLLLRSTSGSRGGLVTIVVVLITFAAIGVAAGLSGRRP